MTEGVVKNEYVAFCRDMLISIKVQKFSNMPVCNNTSGLINYFWKEWEGVFLKIAIIIFLYLGVTV